MIIKTINITTVINVDKARRVAGKAPLLAVTPYIYVDKVEKELFLVNAVMI